MLCYMGVASPAVGLFYACHGKNGMKKATVRKTRIVALINLIIVALPIVPCAAPFLHAFYEFCGVVLYHLLQSLVAAFVVLLRCLLNQMPVYCVWAVHHARSHLSHEKREPCFHSSLA
jgi:hypothetical protein